MVTAGVYVIALLSCLARVLAAKITIYCLLYVERFEQGGWLPGTTACFGLAR
jgi:hypothetical protein